jgi:hypothetical protein
VKDDPAFLARFAQIAHDHGDDPAAAALAAFDSKEIWIQNAVLPQAIRELSARHFVAIRARGMAAALADLLAAAPAAGGKA